MADDLFVDPDALREHVRDKYREVAADPHRTFHLHIGRVNEARLGYEADIVDARPDRAVESFAGAGYRFSLRRLQPGERVVDVGSGAGFDSIVVTDQVGDAGCGRPRQAEMMATHLGRVELESDDAHDDRDGRA